MTIQERVTLYQSQGFQADQAKAHAAADIILLKIGSSKASSYVTIKGGMLLYNLTKNARRATTDLDFDFIRYSLDDVSLKAFIRKLDSLHDGIHVFSEGKFQTLKHLDYQGKRVVLRLKDASMELMIKLDIGVHTFSAIAQSHLLFSCGSGNGGGVLLQVNPNEQIFVEKIVSLARLGPISTRFKDIYDLYYLVSKGLLERAKTAEYLDLFLQSGHYPFQTKSDLYLRIEDTLKNPIFSADARKPSNNWISDSYEKVCSTLLDFLFDL